MLVELEIVKKLKEKDVSAFEWLYDLYAPALHGMIIKLTQDMKMVTMILHESFIKVWHLIESFDTSKDKLFMWILRITIKQCKDVLHLPNDIILETLELVEIKN